jgi:signal transduction histidine kinase
VPADARVVFREPLARQAPIFARLVRPYLERLDASLSRRLKRATAAVARDPRQLKALSLITSGAAARLLSAGRPAADFFEQVAYNSRRLAKLNVAPTDVVKALEGYDRDLDLLLANRHPREHAALQAVRQQLHLRTLLTVNNAYYQVREAETQAFYGLLRAEMDATGLDDLLRRFILILTRTFRAQSGRLIPLLDQSSVAPHLLKRLARPRYISAGTPDERLVLDQNMRGVHQSYWSIPFFSGRHLAGLIQFGFPTPYRWLPRELDLLNGFAERCLRAAERARLIEDLAAREAQVRSLAGHLLQAEDEERGRISRELHDEAGQSMLFLRLHLEMLERRAPPDMQPKLAEARAVSEQIIADIRRLIAALSPSAVEELGLLAAIRHLSARFRKLYPIKLRLRLVPYAHRLPRATETTAYRIVQESYQNIAKHSTASHVNLSLKFTDTLLELDIEDDGVGFDVDSALAQPQSFGLKGMRERVALLGGRLEIRSSPGQGATISMRLPIPFG